MNQPVYYRMNAPKVVHETFDDNEVVIINLDTGSYYSLDKIGAEIWNLIESCISVDEIIESMIQRYEPDGLNIESAIHRFIEELKQEQLIIAHTNGATRNILKSDQIMNTEPLNSRPTFQEPILQKYTDMQDLLLLDPIHEVDDTGWPKSKED